MSKKSAVLVPVNKTASMLVLYYVLFAAFSILANVSTQYLIQISIHFYYNDWLALVAGTAVGLISKYLLDKHYIFCHVTTGVISSLKNFILYCVMGLVTTIIFWGFEVILGYATHSLIGRYTGGIIGLSIGYYVKYLLDNKYVFKNST